ncbi:MAG: four-carbon acid sugar kinase family protein [Lachnospiraceae bacterium]
MEPFLRHSGAGQIFIKYCSTFDSTPKGNIGPVVDAVMEELDVKYTILCPALPVNGRTVKDGRLYVNGVPLDESPMRNHPLTPMWDSSIASLMRPQGKYDCLVMNREMMRRTDSGIQAVLEDFGRDRSHFYVIPDYINDSDADRIVALFGDLPLLTGGSGLMERLARRHGSTMPLHGEVSCATKGPALVLAGSCSVATLAQIRHFTENGACGIRLDPDRLKDPEAIAKIREQVRENRGRKIILYSSVPGEELRRAGKSKKQIAEDAAVIEQSIADIAENAVEDGYTRIIVAGGETSGAVTKRLGFSAYDISDSVAPGVPVMIPVSNRKIRLVLKSGNFGQEDFFDRALSMTTGA